MKTVLLDPDDPDPQKRVDTKLPMIDPHELLDWLHATEKVAVTAADCRRHGS